jgi:hypothetical protein
MVILNRSIELDGRLLAQSVDYSMLLVVTVEFEILVEVVTGSNQ